MGLIKINKEIRWIIKRALKEDIGYGDITTNAIFSNDLPAKGTIIAKEEMVLAGVDIIREVFTSLNPSIIFTPYAEDGDRLKEMDLIAHLWGDGRIFLMGERVALNFLQRLSGIATITARFVDEIKGLKTTIIDTRKTTPNIRILEKEAVKIGGGKNHRFGLMDGVLIKENHIALAGGIENAIKRARDASPHTLRIEVEVSSIEDIKRALECKADIIMFDNMDMDSIRRGVEIVKGRALIEVSGRVDINNVREIAASGIDMISIGALTHSAKSVDISMEIIKDVAQG